MQTISGSTREFSPQLQHAMATYRHKIFIERLGWDLPVANGQETDEFDRPDTVYVLGKDAAGNITGCARLLPTTRPYLLGEIFPELMNGQAVPRASDIWELSRFAAVDLNLPATRVNPRDEAYRARALLRSSIETAMGHGATRLITVSPLGIERLLARMGVHAHRAGPPVLIDGKPVFACWIEIDEQTCAALDISLRHDGRKPN
jgi:N-acyl-L-homoserine lactone synthetase